MSANDHPATIESHVPYEHIENGRGTRDIVGPTQEMYGADTRLPPI